jgi:hypothetical protein
MRLYFYIINITILIALLGGCSKDNPGSADLTGSASVSEITGRLNNWNHGSNKTTVLIGTEVLWNSDKIYSSSSIDSLGNFSLKNLDAPSSIMFIATVYPKFAEATVFKENTLRCSDSSAIQVKGHLVIPDDSLFSTLGFLFNKNFEYSFHSNRDSVKAGDYFVEYIYVNKDVSLNGVVDYELAADPPAVPRIKSFYKINYDLSFQKGWNKKVTFVKSQIISEINNAPVLNAEYNISNYEPSQSNWYYTYFE